MVPALLGAVLGPALQLQQAALWPWPAYAALAVLALAAAGCRAVSKASFGRGMRAASALLAAGILAFAATGLRAAHFAAQGLDAALEGRDIAVTGVIAAMPQPTELGQRLRFQVESAHLDGQPVRLPPRLLLGWYGGPWPVAEDRMELQRPAGAGLRAGDRWRFNVRLKAPHGNQNPHGFDYELWLWEQGLQATGYVRAGPRDPAPRHLGATWRHPVELARQRVREAIFERVPSSGVAGILAALVVGDQQAIERADWDVFRATGVAHLMSISGLHVTMFAWAAAWAVGALWRRSARLCLALPAQHAALAGGVLLAAAYAVFSGWGVPAQRTVWMLAAVAVLRLAGARWPWPALWLLAAAVVVAVDPWALLQAGFWLSFVAVGVLFATDRGLPAQGWRPGAWLSSVAREQAVVTLALAPLSLLLFGQVSLVGLAANVVAIPWVTLVVTPLALAGVLLPPLWDAAAWAVQGLAAGLQALAALPGAVLSTAAPPPWAGAAGVAGGLLLAMRLPPALRALGLPLLLPALLWQPPRPAHGQFELLAADVGQGNAVIVRTARHTLVYDAGPRYSAEADAGHRVLVPLLRAWDERVHTLVVSHRDSDHSGGAAAVLAMQPQAALLTSIAADHALAALRRPEPCTAGQRWSWDGVAFEVLHPRPDDFAAARRPNAVSCVLRIANGTATALLAGDIELPQEAALLRRGAPLRADLLLVPHHGSKTSSGEAFLQAVQPRIALVQAGYRNRFGHPAAAVAERYRRRGVRLVESAACGAAAWASARPAEVACRRQQTPRYWRHQPS
ncbi:DNA internalization-related competence protein-like protein [Ramlibacter tataouinensis TTB310]|uniref:DNA internalization-related competence protein-like protein n=2 Tax=Ramlibacter tataouinensis TaxID=94132 RepID=F5Y2T7_RAMTT|nr:DNA internalization-related competence protein-like protein [Ramlibacter tataouinensis TTB310]